ncbi:MAG: hypothetical protein V3U86_06360 [Acidobacteriota bacterium]
MKLHTTPRLVLGSSLAILLAAAVAMAAGEEEPPQPARTAEPLRGSGYLILDHRDSQETVKARFRKFVDEVRLSVPPELSREETRQQVDAFLESDLTSSEDLPHLDLEFAAGVTRENLIAYLENTASAQESRLICSLSCPVRAMFRNGFHIHLTRPAGGLGDSVFALELHGSRADHGPKPSQTSTSGLDIERHSLLDRYPVADDGRKPIGRVFGVRIYLGEPAIPESSQLPPD